MALPTVPGSSATSGTSGYSGFGSNGTAGSVINQRGSGLGGVGNNDKSIAGSEAIFNNMGALINGLCTPPTGSTGSPSGSSMPQYPIGAPIMGGSNSPQSAQPGVTNQKPDVKKDDGGIKIGGDDNDKPNPALTALQGRFGKGAIPTDITEKVTSGDLTLEGATSEMFQRATHGHLDAAQSEAARQNYGADRWDKRVDEINKKVEEINTEQDNGEIGDRADTVKSDAEEVQRSSR